MLPTADTEYHLCLVGDKGKAQLTRDQPEKIVWFIGDLQKQGVTFSQVGGGLLYHRVCPAS